MRNLTNEETHILKLLTQARDAYDALSQAHPGQLAGFTYGIDFAEEVVLGRPRVEEMVATGGVITWTAADAIWE